ncbi:MAG TPA: biotin synthase BioB [Syntrophales bacterium]|nr:biotin synthase BioB [Syntrophales bacterium]
MKWDTLSRNVLGGKSLTHKQALGILETSDDELLAVLDAAFAIRRRYFGRGVSIHVIRNAKSGLCSENCSFCSQSAVSTSGIPRYQMQSVEEILEGARDAHKFTAVRYCIVTSGRSPGEKDLATICEAARLIKQEVPVQICTSLGLLSKEQAERLKKAGVDRYNHNLESSERFYSSFCTTHAFSDRVATAKVAKAAGLELCSGGLVGMGEGLQDRVDLAFALRDLDADSVPLNFLDPRPGTPLAGLTRLTAGDCLRTLAMFRFVIPDREIRIAGGREACIGSLQALSLYAANSLFTKGYLTTPGQGYEADMEMIRQAGFTVTEIVE